MTQALLLLSSTCSVFSVLSGDIAHHAEMDKYSYFGNRFAFFVCLNNPQVEVKCLSNNRT